MIDWTHLIIGITSVVVTVVLIPLIREKYQQVRTETIDYWLRIFMASAETYFSTGEGKAKKEWVLEHLSAKFPKLDIDMLSDCLEAMFRELVVEGLLNNPDI